MSAKYFQGSPSDMGHVSGLAATTFAELVESTIRQPVPLPFTQAELFAMPDKEQGQKKAVTYLVPAEFKSDPSPRKTPHATQCNLLFIDVDDSAEALRMLKAGFPNLLGNLNAAVWHTARSTPQLPRLRIMVPCDPVPVGKYPSAVMTLAALLGMTTVTKESKIAVQAMYLPVQYKDSTDSPTIYEKLDGDSLNLGAAMSAVPTPAGGSAVPPASPTDDDSDMGDIEYLRAPVEGVDAAEIETALTHIDPSCSMQQWVEVGMAIKHQFGDSGFTLWDDWSSKSKEKYVGQEETAKRWESFDGQTKNRVPVTIRSVIKAAVEGGWNNRQMTSRMFEACRSWIRDSARSSEELLDQGAKRIAKIGSVIGPIEQKVLISDLHSTIKSRGLRGPTTLDIAKAIKGLTAAATRAAAVTPPWAQGIVFATASNLFFRYTDSRKMKGEVVDLIYKAPTPEVAARDYLIHDVGIPVVENLRYHPADKRRIFVDRGVPFCNTYIPSYPKADIYAAEEAGALWIEHAQNLFGTGYWQVPTDFIAYCVQYPGRKIRFVLFVQSGVGAGKGLKAYVCELVLGAGNVQRLAAEHVLEGTHNGWASGYQLTILDEVRIVGHNRHRVMDKMKPLISDSTISVRQIYEPVQTVPNTTNYIMFTNHLDALAVHKEDRRYWICNSPLQTRQQIMALGADYFDRMYSGFRKNAAGLRAFFENWPISPTFNPEGRAPITPFLADMARQSASPLACAVAEVIDDQPHPLVRRDLVSITALRGFLDRERVGAFSDKSLASILREEGYAGIGRHLVDGAKHDLYALDPNAPNVARAQQRMDLL